jgi:nicotinate (nicotinamide) nucleotide adenylyltransferase
MFGGSFNPPHRGHVEFVRAALAEGGIDHLFVVPAHRSPFKGEQALLPGELRYHMMRAALKGVGRTSVLDLEVSRPPPSYTVRTLEVLQAWCPRAGWTVMMGSDVFRGIRAWYRADRLFELASLTVLARADGGDPLPEELDRWIPLLPGAWKDRARKGTGAVLVDEQGRRLVERLGASIAPISSSHIREDNLLDAVAPGARELLRNYLDSRSR